jgi:hypothetical protein
MNQELLNSIATLGALIDPLTRAEQKDAVNAVTVKLLELIEKVK